MQKTHSDAAKIALVKLFVWIILNSVIHGDLCSFKDYFPLKGG
jgi:hypothetical protein